MALALTRDRAGPGEGWRSTEGTMASSTVSSTLACNVGIHGDGGGAFFGSRMEAASPAVPGQKEEGWSELVQRGVQQAENGEG